MEEYLKQMFEKEKGRKKVLLYVWRILLLIGAAFLVLVFTFDPETLEASSDDFEVTMIVAGIVSVISILGVINMKLSLRKYNDFTKWPTYTMLVTNKNDIAWAYLGEANFNMYGVHVHKKRQVVVYDKNGKIFVFGAYLGISKEQQEHLAASLETYFPNATLGWSEEKSKVFMNQPSALLKNR